ncbi:MAG: class I SAM-dependent methyltransferase [Haloarculaceae archaeon]
MDEQARKWWNGWADRFQEEYGGGETQVGMDWGPGAPKDDDLGLLGDLEGTRAVELGCGGAQFGIAVAEHGADVTGVDISAAQLAHARENAEEYGQDIELVESSVTDLPLASGSFDLAFSSFAFQWVEDLEACFAEADRVLTDGGRLVFSVDHPYYKLLDPETGELARSYFDPSPRRAHSEELDAEMVIYRRPVSETVNLLVEAGFIAEELREPGYADPEAYVSEFGSFDTELMATVPPTIVYAARTE